MSVDTEIKFRTIRRKYVTVTKEDALRIARRLYRISKGEYRTELINRRFIGIEFTWEQLYNCERKERRK